MHRGQITSPIWMIRQKGFDLGSVITFPVGNAAEKEALDPDEKSIRSSYVITDTNALHVSVELTVLGEKEKRVVSAKGLLKYAKLGKGSRAEVSHPRWPSERLIDQKHVRQAYWVALGQGALCTLAHPLTNEVSDQCDILLRPSRCVRLKKDVKLGELALLPEGRVVFYPAEKTLAAPGAGAVHLELGVK